MSSSGLVSVFPLMQTVLTEKSDLFYCIFLFPLAICITGKSRIPFFWAETALTTSLEWVFKMHFPTWGDCQEILLTLFTSEERNRIQRAEEQAKLEMGEGWWWWNESFKRSSCSPKEGAIGHCKGYPLT